MAAPPVEPNVVRFQLQWSIGSDNNAITGLKYTYAGGPPTAADLNNLCAGVYGLWGPLTATWATPAVSLNGVAAQDLGSSTGASGIHTQVTIGARTGNPIPPANAVLVNYTVARRYRGGKPRSYLPFMSGSDTTAAGRWGGSEITALSSALATLFTATLALTSSGVTLTDHVNVSLYEGTTVSEHGSPARAENVPTYRSSALVEPITSFSVSLIPSTQRRRNRA